MNNYIYEIPRKTELFDLIWTTFDAFYSGIILFAMVNGRLPFNDNQLLDMEEEMKMQRLRFERAVSFGKW